MSWKGPVLTPERLEQLAAEADPRRPERWIDSVRAAAEATQDSKVTYTVERASIMAVSASTEVRALEYLRDCLVEFADARRNEQQKPDQAQPRTSEPAARIAEPPRSKTTWSDWKDGAWAVATLQLTTVGGFLVMVAVLAIGVLIGGVVVVQLDFGPFKVSASPPSTSVSGSSSSAGGTGSSTVGSSRH